MRIKDIKPQKRRTKRNASFKGGANIHFPTLQKSSIMYLPTRLFLLRLLQAKKSEEGTLKTHLLWQLMSDVCIQNIMKANTIKSKRKHNKRIWNPFWVCDINEGSVRHIKFILSKHSKMYKGVRSCKNQKDNKLHRIKFWIYLKIVFSSHLSE